MSGWGADCLPAFYVTTFAGEPRDRGTRAASIGGKYLEDCAVAPVDDTPSPFADGVRSRFEELLPRRLQSPTPLR